MSNCNHTMTTGKEGEKGWWCVECGKKISDVETNECKDCAHFFASTGYFGCRKLMMRVSPTMRVTFEISKGSCWEKQP